MNTTFDFGDGNGNARIYGNAQVYGNARVFGEAWVHGRARVFGNAQAYGNAQVCDRGWSWGDEPVPALAEQQALAREILARLEAGGDLRMDAWHSCATAHCVAGWVQVLCTSPDNNTAYQDGVRLLPAMAPYFFDSETVALERLKELAK
ncbi:MAG: hypothetical protein HC882_01900 [Acidobacteria bacterium]|nr:hypothetical protein [Acidobacteriota bacterium]